MRYPLQAIVSDDNINIYEACKVIYPAAVTQLCLNHYKEGIRSNLEVRTDPTYRPFMQEIEYLFKQRRSKEEFINIAAKITRKYGSDPRCMSVMIDIQRRMDMLCAYMNYHHIPRTNNLIGSFNSHLQGRLKTIKGFESITHATMWLNAYFLRRRMKKFTGCEGKFRGLNGYSSLDKSQNTTISVPSFFLKNAPVF